MPDKEKIINDLQDAVNDDWLWQHADYYALTMKRAIALLKEQEAVDPEVEVPNEIDRIYRCPRCHKCFFYAKQKFCDQCGQAVKW